VRYRTAAILSALVIVSMFTFTRAVENLLLPSLPDPVPIYDQLLLVSAEMCLRWWWVVVPVITIVLFSVAGTAPPPAPRRDVALRPAKRPLGVLVLAIVNLFAGLAALIGLGATLWRSGDSSVVVVLVLVILLFNIVCTLALLMLKNWARIVFIAVFGLALIRTPGHIYSEIANLSNHWAWIYVLGDICYFCFLVWTVWYVFRPHVKVAFGKE
jgi:hypothetical protein